MVTSRRPGFGVMYARKINGSGFAMKTDYGPERLEGITI